MGFAPPEYTVKILGDNITIQCLDTVFPENPVVPYTVHQVEICPNETGKNTQFESNGNYS